MNSPGKKKIARTIIIPVLTAGLLAHYGNNLNAVEQETARYKKNSEYYVSVNGSDENPGTKELPFATIQKAADTTVAGDKVFVGLGTYREHLVIKNSGTEEAPIIFSGERGPNGEWKTIIDPGVPVSKWKSAPEIGPFVYKTGSIPFNPRCMTFENKSIARIADRLMLLKENGSALKEITGETMEKDGMGGFTLLNLPEDTVSSHAQLGGKKINFWDGVEILCGYLDGKTYIRFRNGENPNGKPIKASGDKPGINIVDKNNIIIRNFMVRNAKEALVIEGKNARNIIIENNCLMHGTKRICILDGASGNTIRNNFMTLGYLHGDFFTAGSAEEKLCRHLYTVFKYIIGPKNSDDKGVYISSAGRGNEICGNIIYRGLVGISSDTTPDLRVYDNFISNMSSVGMVSRGGILNGEFYGNTIYNCGINLRIHLYGNACPMQRKEYYYDNFLFQPENAGMQIFVHHGATLPLSEDRQEINFYHNTICNGSFFHIRKALNSLKERNALQDKPLPFRFVNNIVPDKVGGNIEIFSNNLIVTETKDAVPTNNICISPQEASKYFEVSLKKTSLALMPCLKFMPESPAGHAGIDISRPFTIDGKQYGPMPGMKEGYFSGKAPYVGVGQDKDINEKLSKSFSSLSQ